MEELLVAIDPGRNVGVAWVATDGRLLRHEILDLSALAGYDFPPGAELVVGDGTGSAAVRERLEARGLSYALVREAGTSEEARRLYWRDHPPRGLVRLLPPGLRSPPRALDGYAAYAIGLRALARRPAP